MPIQLRYYTVIIIAEVPGQGSRLQASVLMASPIQSFPPLRASFIIVLFDVLSPPPHVTEQSDQSVYNDHVQLYVTRTL